MFTYTYANNLKKISDESHSHIERKKMKRMLQWYWCNILLYFWLLLHSNFLIAPTPRFCMKQLVCNILNQCDMSSSYPRFIQKEHVVVEEKSLLRIWLYLLVVDVIWICLNVLAKMYSPLKWEFHSVAFCKVLCVVHIANNHQLWILWYATDVHTCFGSCGLLGTTLHSFT